MLLLLLTYVVLRALWKIDVYLMSTLVNKGLNYYYYYYAQHYYSHRYSLVSLNGNEMYMIEYLSLLQVKHRTGTVKQLVTCTCS